MELVWAIIRPRLISGKARPALTLENNEGRSRTEYGDDSEQYGPNKLSVENPWGKGLLLALFRKVRDAESAGLADGVDRLHSRVS